MTSITIHLLIDTQRIAFSCYNLHFLEDWYMWEIFLKPLTFPFLWMISYFSGSGNLWNELFLCWHLRLSRKESLHLEFVHKRLSQTPKRIKKVSKMSSTTNGYYRETSKISWNFQWWWQTLGKYCLLFAKAVQVDPLVSCIHLLLTPSNHSQK